MKKLWLPVIVLMLVGYYQFHSAHPDQRTAANQVADQIQSGNAALIQAIESHADGVYVEGQGTIERILPDDNEGIRHQRFIVRLSSGQTILIAHDIDIAPRVSSLSTGDSVSFGGAYVWNSKGGVVHWTHHDPSGKHRPGWIVHGDQQVQ